jgi:BlaI family transcriptional regulator, penicillinase repressor
MARKQGTQPTEGELAILKVLWKKGACTVREVYEFLGAGRGTGYTTTLKQLQIMAEKGLVKRNEKQRSHIYEANLSEGKALRHLTYDLLQRFFDGSTQKMVLHALAAKRTPPEELARIRNLIENFDPEENRHGGN